MTDREQLIKDQEAALKLLKDGVATTSYAARYFTPRGLMDVAKGATAPDSLISGQTVAEADTMTGIKRKAADWATEQAAKQANPDATAAYTADEWLRGILIVTKTVRAFPV